MDTRPHAPGRAALLAALPPLAACIVQWVLWRWIQPFAWLLFYPAVYLSSRIGGLPGGLAATGLSAVLAVYFFVSPRDSFAFSDPGNYLSIVIFLLSGIFFSISEERLRRTREREINECRRAESASAEASARAERSLTQLALTFQAAGAGVFEVDLKSGRSEASPEILRLYGLLPGAYTHDLSGWEKVVLAEDLPRVRDNVQRAIDTGEASTITFRIRRPDDGEVRWLESRIHVIYDSERQPLRIVGVDIDVTDQVRLEEERKEAEARLELALEAVGAGTWEVDLQTNKVYRSVETWKLLGREPGGVEPWDGGLRQPVHPDDRDRVDQVVRRAVEQGTDCHAEWRVATTDGSLRWVMSKGTPVRDSSGKVVRYRGIVMDITERKRLEDSLRHAQKLEGIGQLAGGVAHEFNNILAAAMMQLEFLRARPNLDRQTQEALKEFEEETQRAANLTRQLLMFSRRSVLALRAVCLNEVVVNLLKMLRRLIGEHIELRFEGQPLLPLVEADPDMLNLIIVNLAVNARDAMSRGGRLTIRTELVNVDSDQTDASPERHPGRFVCVSVEDTGCGIDAATREHIFEPFFTTKDVGKGTGLGLATAYGIVAQHKGWIDVESQPGRGSTFRVFLPVLDRATVPVDTLSEDLPVPRGQETILLVEDDRVLRRAIGESLRSLGYSVFDAADGREALALWQEHSTQVKLLFTDMVMPRGMTGQELAEQLLQAKPDLKAVISSGYSLEIVKTHKPSRPGVVYLPKPFDIRKLADTVRDCMDGRI